VQTITFSDPGSNLNFLTHKLAAALELVGIPTTIHLKVVDAEYREKQVLMYRLGVEDNLGNLHWLEAVGVESITEASPLLHTTEVRNAFPEAPEEALQRPVGPAGLLLSMTERHLHSVGGRAVGRLRLSPTPLGCGWVVTGMSPKTTVSGEASSLSAECRSLQGAAAVRPPQGTTFFISNLRGIVDSVGEPVKEESRLPPLCSACRGCSECKFRREKCSADDLEVLERVDKEMTLEGGVLTGSYPWKACAERMKNNREQALKIQSKTEERMLKDGTYEAYQLEFRKAVATGAVTKVTQEELDTYSGPVNYNTTFGVINENSSTTRLRIVLNSALKNARSGLSLNDCMYQGPDELAVLTYILLHFRTVEAGLIFDVEKAYQAIRTREKDRHLRRILYRPSPDAEWEDWAYD
jgi:hypothetical protein